ncbi:hypothetical protein KP509_07G091600 [Ceratopteris richardii]|nr:hypothetical protein KP509_07G091600 [Ceratopteris richardii]
MKLESFCPDAITYTCSLKACGRLNAAKKGIALHAEIVSMGLSQKDNVLGSSIMDMYIKCGIIMRAHEVLDELSLRTVGSWNVIISGCAKDFPDETLIFFEQMQLEGVSPNVITFLGALKASGSICAIIKGIEIHAELDRKGLVEKEDIVSSSLVDMYCKCGLFTKGHEVFRRLSNRNLELWNALLTGYIQHDFYEAAVSAFTRMCLEGICPDSISFTCALKACGCIGYVCLGMQLHSKIAYANLLSQYLSVGNALIDMYTNLGLLAKAQEVFFCLSGKDIVSWNTLLTGYVRHELYENAFSLFIHMQSQAVMPDAITIASCLKACGACGEVEKGLEMHCEVERTNLLGKDVVIGKALIEMYASCGLITNSQEVFDKLPNQGVEMWNALILAYLINDFGEEALQKLKHMQREGLLPDAITCMHSLKACIINHDLVKGREIHAEISRLGLIKQELSVGISLIEMYMSFAMLDEAQGVFDEITNREAILWNTLIAGYLKHECGAEALHLFESMKLDGCPPNHITFICGLKACGFIRDIRKGEEILLDVNKQGLLEKNIVVGNAVIDMYLKCGLLDKAQDVFYNLPQRDIVSWNTLISGYVDHNHNEESLACLDALSVEGLSADSVTFASSLKACGNMKAMHIAVEIHQEIERRGMLQRDVVIAIALIDAYARCGSLMRAQEVFDRLSERDLTVWNVLIASYLKHECNEEVLCYFEKMRLEGFYGDAITFTSSLRACGNIGAVNKGRKLHVEIEGRSSLTKHLLVGNGMVDMYSKGGFIETAQKVFNLLPVHDLVSWNMLLAGYAQLGDTVHVFSIMERMVGNGIFPDSVTCISVLNVCNHAGLIETAESFITAVFRSYSIIPTMEQYTCMLDLLGRAGQLSKLMQLIMLLPIHPSVVMWCTVLGACRKLQNLELSRHAFKEAMEQHERETVAYVFLYNIYADASE